MTDEQDVRQAAHLRAEALASGSATHLRGILHPMFVWTTHRGDVFDRNAYIESNTSGSLIWKRQRLEGVEVRVVRKVAVLTGEVVDEVERDGQPQTFQMLVTQVWIKEGDQWLCLAGHAGPIRD